MKTIKALRKFSPELPRLARAWRKDNELTLEQAKHRLGLSKSYISMLENEEAQFSDAVFLAYHKADQERFPLELASQLPLDDVADPDH